MTSTFTVYTLMMWIR